MRGVAQIARGGPAVSHTKGMKTAISIPDDVFAGAGRLARRTKKSRSQLFRDAVREVCDELGWAADEFTSLAARRVLEKSEWRFPKEGSGGPICLSP
jgi:predicted transcriptional regulator